jgi:5'-hydroxyaverantin dehydrogenase
MDYSPLKGRSVLITGGASGLGRDTAKSFAAAGAYVTIADVQPSDDLVKNFTDAGHHMQFIHCDVSKWDDQVAAFKKALEFSKTGTIYVVAVFAAVDKAGHLVDQVNTSEVSLEEDPYPPSTLSLEVNLKGCFYTTFLALHYFRLKPKSGVETTQDKALIIVASLAGYIDDTHNSSYTASKFGARGVFRAVRERAQADLGVRVNLIAPVRILMGKKATRTT